MNIEMSYLDIYQIDHDIICGWFRLKNLNGLRVNYKVENSKISFSCPSENEAEKKCFSAWLENEKEYYMTFLLNYVDEIHKMNNIFSFNGHLVEERSFSTSDGKSFSFLISYDELSTNANFTFYPSKHHFNLLYQIPISINSEGQYGSRFFVQHLLTKETIQRMWEPVRDKTKYRLQLLHMLR